MSQAMRHRRRHRRLAGAAWQAAALWGAFALGCGASKSPPEGAPGAAATPPLTEVERTRTTEACTAYVAALCGCAKTKPELQPSCELDASLQQGVSHMLTVEGTVRDDDKRKMAQHQLRRMAATCVERMAQLPTKGCP